MTFMDTLAEQRWDDHRFYHHNRINQSLHLISALSFIVAYLLLVVSPVAAVLVGWLIAMPTRQIGHFFFEPKGYDAANGATHEHKELIKVGYNLRRKVVLMAIWVLSALALVIGPLRAGNWNLVTRQVAMVWLAVGIGALVFRMLQLFVRQSVRTGLVWVVKILTDPFHDVLLYYRAPIYVWRGELFDPIVVAEPTP